MTYVAHTVIGVVELTICALLLSMKFGWIDFGSVQALGMLLGMFAAIPAGLIAAYSAVTAIVSLLRRRRVPRDMLLLPAGLIVGVVWGSVVAEFGTPIWTVVAYLPLVGYMIMAFTLVVRYRSGRRRPVEF